MLLRQLKIVRFRGVEEPVVISLRSDSLLVGPNGCGKTTVLAALRLLLGRERMYRELNEYDWPGKRILDPSGAAIEIRISGVLTQLTERDEDVLGPAAGGLALRKWDESTEILTTSDYGGDYSCAATEVGFAARYNVEVGEFEFKRYFKQDESSPFDQDIPVVSEDQLRHVGFFFIPGARTWEQALSFTSSAFLKLLREEGALPGAHLIEVVKSLENARPLVSDAPQLAALLGELRSNVDHHIPTQDLSFNTTKLTMAEVEREQWLFSKSGSSILPITAEGSGFVSLLNLLMICRFVKNRTERGSNAILALEEPELHLYPHVQTRLVADARALGAQLIVTTHSPHLASLYSLEEVVGLRRKDGNTVVVPSLRELATGRPHFYKRVAFMRRTQMVEALMGNAVLLMEGPGDVLFLSKMRAIMAQRFRETRGLSLLSKDGGDEQEWCEMLSSRAERLAVLVDGDTAGTTMAQRVREGHYDQRLPLLILTWANGQRHEEVLVEEMEGAADDVLAELVACSTANRTDVSTLLRFLSNNKTNVEVFEVLVGILASQPFPLPRHRALFESIATWALLPATSGLQESQV